MPGCDEWVQCDRCQLWRLVPQAWAQAVRDDTRQEWLCEYAQVCGGLGAVLLLHPAAVQGVDRQPDGDTAPRCFVVSLLTLCYQVALLHVTLWFACLRGVWKESCTLDEAELAWRAVPWPLAHNGYIVLCSGMSQPSHRTNPPVMRVAAQQPAVAASGGGASGGDEELTGCKPACGLA